MIDSLNRQVEERVGGRAGHKNPIYFSSLNLISSPVQVMNSQPIHLSLLPIALLLFTRLPVVFSSCGDCCSGGSCSSAFHSDSGHCCGQGAGQFYCCPNYASCYARDRDSFVCQSNKMDDSGTSSLAWLLPVLGVLLCCCGIPLIHRWRAHNQWKQEQEAQYAQGGMPPAGYGAQGQPYSWQSAGPMEGTPQYQPQAGNYPPPQYYDPRAAGPPEAPISAAPAPFSSQFPGHGRSIADPAPPPYSPASEVAPNYPRIL